MINIIVATDKNGMIAKDGKIPWYCKEDFKHFKETTWGSPIIMGRKTFETLPGVLPNRVHIILTHQKEYNMDDGIFVTNTLDECLTLIEDLSHEENFVIGGKEIYDLALKKMPVDKILQSVIDTEVEPNETSKYFEIPLGFELVSETPMNGFTLKTFNRI